MKTFVDYDYLAKNFTCDMKKKWKLKVLGAEDLLVMRSLGGVPLH